ATASRSVLINLLDFPEFIPEVKVARRNMDRSPTLAIPLPPEGRSNRGTSVQCVGSPEFEILSNDTSVDHPNHVVALVEVEDLSLPNFSGFDWAVLQFYNGSSFTCVFRGM
ncbi:MAG: hypothetical protein ABUS49_13115, partial [Acidobacteriota bacterium]